MQAQNSGFVGPNGLEIAFTDHAITGWGGLAFVAGFFEKLGVREILRQSLPDGRTSPNQVPVVDIALGLLITVLMGGRRFAHVERLRADGVVPEMFGMERCGSAMTAARYFGAFTRHQTQHLTEATGRFLAERLLPVDRSGVLDLDSTVFG